MPAANVNRDFTPRRRNRIARRRAAITGSAELIRSLPIERLVPNDFSLKVYGPPTAETDGLLESVQEQGLLTPLIVAPEDDDFEIVSGHRRWACAARSVWRTSPAWSGLCRKATSATAPSLNPTARDARLSVN